VQRRYDKGLRDKSGELVGELFYDHGRDGGRVGVTEASFVGQPIYQGDGDGIEWTVCLELLLFGGGGN